MSWLDDYPEEDRRELIATVSAMRVHIGAHALWGDEVTDDDVENGWRECRFCGLTFAQQRAAIRAGRYSCAYSAARRT